MTVVEIKAQKVKKLLNRARWADEQKNLAYKALQVYVDKLIEKNLWTEVAKSLSVDENAIVSVFDPQDDA